MADKPLTIGEAMRKHWPEYLMEAWGLGAFMVSAGLITTILEYSNSPIHQAIEDADLRRMLIGLGMGLTAIAIIYSPWGKQSGAHLNPAVTLTFLRLGKVKALDAVFYIIAQFVGGALGVLLTWAVLGSAFAAQPVDFVNTKPGVAGPVVAYLTELAMAFGIMLMVLTALASGRLMRFIGVFAGLMVATYIAVLAPLSGMSINPARSLASALPGISGTICGSTSPPRSSECSLRSRCFAWGSSAVRSSAPSSITTRRTVASTAGMNRPSAPCNPATW